MSSDVSNLSPEDSSRWGLNPEVEKSRYFTPSPYWDQTHYSEDIFQSQRIIGSRHKIVGIWHNSRHSYQAQRLRRKMPTLPEGLGL